MKTRVRKTKLDSTQEIINFIQSVDEISEDIAGNKADLFRNKTKYLPDWKQFKSDRDMMPIFSIDLPEKNHFSEVLESLWNLIPKTFDLYEKEKPIYDMILWALKGKICTLEFFFKESWNSRKLCYTDSEECLSMTKIIVDGDKMTLICMLRSSNRKKLGCDIIGLYYILIELSKLYTEQTGWSVREKNIQLILCDYQHIEGI